MQLIDSHVHFWDLSKNMNKWVFNARDELKNNFSPMTLPNAKFVHIEAHDSDIDTEHESTWLDESFPNHDMRYISCIDFFLGLKDFNSIVLRLKSNKKVVGFRHILAYHPTAEYSPMKNDSLPADFQDKLTILYKNNMVFECQMYPSQILHCIDSITESKVTTVIEHMGLPLCNSEQDFLVWKQMIEKIGQCENITLKLSGFFMLNNNLDQLEVAMDWIQQHIPTVRLCYGSNHPVCNTNDYMKWHNTLSKYIPNEHYHQVFAETANKVYWRL
ncbi:MULTISPECIES: amidohydrolase family protein [Cysteiniphilum]|uniref:Amidohydrolase n=1 Tax=Cysteiniphilum litorale TaxID=2056700 RepID=A0A8J2Z2W7_9GAMM|nr:MULTISPECIES: amidohydrolase family protein [Cysteiniphilum]GGF91292.1 amidohydrolase [Cysteiniphilum litorale]